MKRRAGRYDAITDPAIATAPDDEDPREIGPYAIIGLLGVGGMGEVYLGVCDGGYAAVKRIRPHLVSAERFKREVGILHRVPAGVTPEVLAHDSTPNRPWFAVDYVPGLTLDETVKQHGPLPAAALWLLLTEGAEKLRTVHAAGIVHRDLKPANLMLVRDGVRLIDFGIARATDQARLTRPGASYGTPGFTAPEQAASDRGDEGAAPGDVYSLGALLAYAAGGRVDDLEPVRRADPALAELVCSCLAADPYARPSAAELVALAPVSAGAWPADVMDRIEQRRRFAATPPSRIDTLPRTPLPSSPFVAPQVPPSGGPWLSPAAEKLAADVRRQWEQEERLRQVHDPYPLPVRFAQVAPGLADHWANIRRAGPRVGWPPVDQRADPAADPGADPAGDVTVELAEELTGDLAGITAIYRSLPSRRLAVLGEAGSGKTILALRFVLDCLDNHAAGERIPVIFALGSWDPTTLSLHDWMCRQLARDHNFLAETDDHGRSLAEELIDDARVLPVLDGFDEVAPGLRAAALDALNLYGGMRCAPASPSPSRAAGPMLLTSRPGEYARAVREHDVLTATACVELEPLRLDDIDEYLTRASAPAPDPRARTVWEPVLASLRSGQRGPGVENLAEALSTPLMVALARTIYSDTARQDPRELLDTDRFGSAEDIREHLLTRFVPAAYGDRPAAPQASGPARRRSSRRWSGERPQRWLEYLAWHLERHGRQDLAWWELGTTLPLLPRMVVVGTVVGLVTGLLGGLVYGVVDAVSAGVVHGVETGLVNGFMMGLGIGLTTGVLHGAATRVDGDGPVFEPSYLRIRLRGTISARRLVRIGLPRFLGGVLGGLLFGVVWAIGRLLYAVVLDDTFGPALIAPTTSPSLNAIVVGTVQGVVIGLAIAVAGMLESASETEKAASPQTLLGKSRANATMHLAAIGILTGITYGLFLDPVTGVAAALMTPAVLGVMRCWGRWVVMSRVWLPLTGRTPLSLMSFLDDAHHRGVLRQTGAVYQFRHARIQTQLAEQFER